MTEFVFAPPAPVHLAIAGESARFPIRRIFCVGRNYEAHAREMNMPASRDAPIYFTKAAQHCVPSGSTVAYPPRTENYHHEMELVIAIGAEAFQRTRDNALACVFGYACGLDMTRRDLQVAAREQGNPWDLGKDFEGAAVISPIVPAAKCGHLSRGRIELSVNGVLRQSSDIGLMIHNAAAIIADLSSYYRLLPGDVIFTGTPEGVGPVRPGDRIEGRIEGLGEIALLIDPAQQT
jgi:fumarylpyruvate hydrolase